MSTLNGFVAFALLCLGGALAVANAWKLVSQLAGKGGSSVTPLVGGILLFLGGLVMPGSALLPWAWVGLFLDLGCIPYASMALVSMALGERGHSEENQLLLLEYHSGVGRGTFAVYQNGDCVHAWRLEDGSMSGSTIMHVDEYEVDAVLRVSVQDIYLALRKRDGQWVVDSQGEGLGRAGSLEGCAIREK